MAEFPALPLWTDAFIADTTHLDARETGAYMCMLMASWRAHDGGIPDDDKILARFARCSPRAWQDVRAVVMAFWTMCADGKWRQKRLEKERIWVRAKSSSAAHAARVKWLKWNETPYADASPPHMPDACGTDAPIPIPIEESKKEDPPPPSGSAPPQVDGWRLLPGATIEISAKQPRKAKPPDDRHPYPSDWQPSPHMRDTLKSKGYSDHEIDWQRDRFDAHFSQSREKRPGWDRSFLKWITNDPPGKHDPARNGRGNGGRGPGIVAGVSALLASYRNIDDDR